MADGRWLMADGRLDGGDIGRQSRVDELIAVQFTFCVRDSPGRLWRRLHVIRAIHQQQVIGAGMRGKTVAHLADEGRKAFRFGGGQQGRVAVSIAQVCHEDARAIWRLPPEFARLVAQTAPQAG